VRDPLPLSLPKGGSSFRLDAMKSIDPILAASGRPRVPSAFTRVTVAVSPCPGMAWTSSTETGGRPLSPSVLDHCAPMGASLLLHGCRHRQGLLLAARVAALAEAAPQAADVTATATATVNVTGAITGTVIGAVTGTGTGSPCRPQRHPSGAPPPPGAAVTPQGLNDDHGEVTRGESPRLIERHRVARSHGVKCMAPLQQHPRAAQAVMATK